MAWTKAKTTLAIGAATLLVVGTATVAVRQFQGHRADVVQRNGFSPDDSTPGASQRKFTTVTISESGGGPGGAADNLNPAVLDHTPPQVHIEPSKSPNSSGWISSGDKMMGTAQSLEQILLIAYGENNASRLVSHTKLPDGKFDFIANLPQDSRPALQRELKKQFGLTASHQTRPTDILRLSVKNPDSAGLEPGQSQSGGAHSGPGRFGCQNMRLSSLVSFLEGELKIPIVDATGLAGPFNVTLTWEPAEDSTDSLKKAVLDQLGLELVPARQAVQMLVVEKAK